MARQIAWKMLVVGVAVAGLTGAGTGTATADTPAPRTQTTVLASDDDFFDDHGGHGRHEGTASSR